MSKVKSNNLFWDKIHLTLKNALCIFRKKWITVTVGFALTIVAMALISVFVISLSIKAVTSDNVIDIDEAKELDGVDYVIILGAGLRPDGSPSDMLTDRLLTGIALVGEPFEGKLLLTGDNSGEHYNEVGAMHTFALDAGISENMIVDDDYGFSTYESIYRAKHEFNAEKVIIVTQGYHLHRAIYIAEEMGIEAYGVSADIRSYRGQTYRDLREHLARLKDFFVCLISEEEN